MSDQTQNTLPEINGRVSRDRVYFGLITATIGFIVFIFGAKPDWFNLDRSPVVGFVQITVFLVGLAFIYVAVLAYRRQLTGIPPAGQRPGRAAGAGQRRRHVR